MLVCVNVMQKSCFIYLFMIKKDVLKDLFKKDSKVMRIEVVD